MKFTGHARERMAEMGLHEPDVLAVIREAEIHYISDRHLALGDRHVHIRGRLAVVTTESDGKVPRVTTVLWHTGHEDEWSRESGPIPQIAH